MIEGTEHEKSCDAPPGVPRQEDDASSLARNTSTLATGTNGPESGDALEDKVTEAVERSYASRIIGGTDLSPEEVRRVQGKQAQSVAGGEPASGR